MQHLGKTIIRDTHRMDQADPNLVTALRAARNQPETLPEVLTGRTVSEVRAACEILFSEDRSVAFHVVAIAEQMHSRSLIDFALRRMGQDTYYSRTDRFDAEEVQRRIYIDTQREQPNGHPKKAK